MEGMENVRCDNDKDGGRETETMEEGSDGDSNESLSGDEEEIVDEGKIRELQQQLVENPFLYDSHTELIRLLQSAGELDTLREAREKMSESFPLAEDLWLDWVRDEVKLVAGEVDRGRVEKLFERAVKDYLSVPIWLEYVQFAIGGMGTSDGMTKIREIFERAVTAVGLHTGRGAMVWEAYREFENAILAGLVPQAGFVSNKEKEKEFDAQHERVVSLFKRQLAIPLLDMEDTFQEYLDWMQEDKVADASIKQAYEKALDKLKKLKPLEEALIHSSPGLEQYRAYIDFEISQGEPPRIQCIFERAIAENCLNSDLWEQYTTYLDTKLKVKPLVLSLYQRAIRNCPWSVQLWQKYVLAQERYEEPHEAIKGTVDAALTAGLSSGSDYQQMWTTYCDYLRRRIKWDGEHEEELSLFRETIERAVAHLLENFGAEGDKDGSLRNFWALIEAKFCKNMAQARELWNQIMTEGHGTEANLWMEYYRLERCYGDNKHCRKILQRALNSVTDWPQAVVEAYIHFERVEGDLEQYDTAVCKCNAQIQRISERLNKAAEKEAYLQGQKKHARTEKKAQKKADQKQTQPQQKQGQSQKQVKHVPPDTESSSSNDRKRKFETESEAQGETESFKVPPPPGYKGPKVSNGPPPGYRGPKAAEEPPSKKPHIQTEADTAKSQEQEERIKHDPSKDARTVFVSNLLFSIEADRLGEIFSKCGEITDIRLVHNYRGKSKGYGFVEFKDKSSVQVALRMDRSMVENRPMYVSPSQDKSQTKTQFRFGTGLERNKLFIKNLPFTCSQVALSTIFGEYGELKDVRLVTYKSGAPKGLAYVEYVDAQCASEAILKTDGLQIGDHAISVALSNPPERKTPFNLREELTPSLGSGKKESEWRGKAKTMVALLPRSVSSSTKTKTEPANKGQGDSSSTTNNKAEDKTGAGMSNQDFRQFLLNK